MTLMNSSGIVFNWRGECWLYKMVLENFSRIWCVPVICMLWSSWVRNTPKEHRQGLSWVAFTAMKPFGCLHSAAETRGTCCSWEWIHQDKTRHVSVVILTFYQELGKIVFTATDSWATVPLDISINACLLGEAPFKELLILLLVPGQCYWPCGIKCMGY